MWIALALIGVVIVIALILVVPRSKNAADGPLPDEVETRILLGEDPDAPEVPGQVRRPSAEPPAAG